MRASCLYVAQNTHAIICVLYHDDPLPTVYNNNINRKELYDFYYTLVTLTTGYKSLGYKSVIKSYSPFCVFYLLIHGRIPSRFNFGNGRRYNYIYNIIIA